MQPRKNMEEIIINTQNNVKKLIFLFHGYGANKENLLPIGKIFANEIPNSEVHIPDGIDICPHGLGRQWFALENEDINLWEQAFNEKKSHIENYIIDTVKTTNIDYANVVLTGFSQGGTVAITLGLNMNIGAIISFSGLYFDSYIDIRNITTKVLMTHGDADPITPITAMYTMETYLKQNNITVKTIISKDVEHAIDENALIGAIKFLKESVKN